MGLTVAQSLGYFITIHAVISTSFKCVHWLYFKKKDLNKFFFKKGVYICTFRFNIIHSFKWPLWIILIVHMWTTHHLGSSYPIGRSERCTISGNTSTWSSNFFFSYCKGIYKCRLVNSILVDPLCFYHIYPTPPLRQDMTQGQFF